MSIAWFAMIAGAAAGQLGWPTGSVHHAFHNTRNGQLHYVTSGLKESRQAPIVYLHSHPRSSVEFKYVLAELNGSMPLIAVDWFGMGFSDDYKGQDAKDEFCTFEEFATYVLEIVEKEGVREFTTAGWLKGAHPALEVAAQAGAGRVKKVALMGLLILSPTQQDYISNVLVPKEKNPEVLANGSHLLEIWNDPSSTSPIYPGEELVNQEKTNDASLSMFTNWQMQAAWAAYNEKLPKRLAAVDAFADTLFVHPLVAYNNWKAYGLDPAFSLAELGRVLTHGRNSSYFVQGTEGMLHQNASYLANLITEFVGLSDQRTQVMPMVV